MRDGMPLFSAYVFWVSACSIHLMKSAAACWFCEALGMASIQLPIMPTPLPDWGPRGWGEADLGRVDGGSLTEHDRC